MPTSTKTEPLKVGSASMTSINIDQSVLADGGKSSYHDKHTQSQPPVAGNAKKKALLPLALSPKINTKTRPLKSGTVSWT